MRGLKTWAWAAVLAATTASPAFAQLTSGTSTGTSTGTTRTSTGGINGTSSSSSSSSLGNSGNGSGSGGSSNISNTNSASVADSLANIQQQNLAYTNIGTTTNSNLQKSNFLSGFYANPMSMGAMTTSSAGGFGTPTLGTTTGTGSVTGSRTGTTTGGQRSGTGSTSTQSGILIPLPVQIAYSAQVRFPTAPVPTSQLQTDLRGIIDRAGLPTPRSVQIVVTGTDVTLRGSVKDEEDARFVEGLVRTTPGVGNIANELTFPAVPK